MSNMPSTSSLAPWFFKLHLFLSISKGTVLKRHLLPEAELCCCFPEFVDLFGIPYLQEIIINDQQRVSPDGVGKRGERESRHENRQIGVVLCQFATGHCPHAYTGEVEYALLQEPYFQLGPICNGPCSCERLLFSCGIGEFLTNLRMHQNSRNIYPTRKG